LYVILLATYRPNLFKHILTYAGQTVWETGLLWSLRQSSKQHIGQNCLISSTTHWPDLSYFINNTILSISSTKPVLLVL